MLSRRSPRVLALLLLPGAATACKTTGATATLKDDTATPAAADQGMGFQDQQPMDLEQLKSVAFTRCQAPFAKPVV